MSVEIKCDRCGKPIESSGDDGTYSSRVSNSNFEILRNGKLELHDLCDDCMEKLDIFMSGKMLEPTLHGELVYLELPNPNVCIYEKELITFSADLEPLTKLIEGHGYAYLPLSAVKQVILGVHLR